MINSIFGWYSEDDLGFLQKIIYKFQPKLVIEIGTFQGRSAKAIAEVLTGLLFCIDSWEYSLELTMQKNLLEYQNVFSIFMDNLKKYDLKNIIPLKGSSYAVSRIWTLPIDLLHIDGGHNSIDVYDDIKFWSLFLKDDGIIIGHDWNNPDVREGVFQAERDMLITNIQKLANEENAPICTTSPAPDGRCIWTATKRI